MDRIRYESRALSAALLTYLQGRGFNIDKVEEAFFKEVPLTIPAISVHFVSSKMQERQMGRDAKSFKRPIQVDAYMESELRAKGIIDAVGDFMDEITVSVTDPMNSNALLAYMTCFDTESIVLDTLPPITTSPELIRWRGVAKCVYDVDYLDTI